MSRVNKSSRYPYTRATIVLLYRLVLLSLSVCRKTEITSFHLQSHLLSLFSINKSEIEIFDQPVLNYKLMRVFAEPFVVPRLNTVLKKSVLLCRA